MFEWNGYVFSKGAAMKILCYGDSNTYGYDPRSFWGDPYPTEHRWVDILARKLGCEAINAGQNGREIPRREGEFLHFDRMLAQQRPIDLLVIMLGTNDLLQGNSAQEVSERMESFLSRIDPDQSNILLICPPPMKLGEWVTSRALIDASIELSNEFKALSQRLGIRFADAGNWDISLAFDGVHFTEEGHSAFAEGLFHELHKGDQLCLNPI